MEVNDDNHLLALQAICCSVQTLLGPSKSLKCCLPSDSSSEDDDGLISDPLQLVDYLVGGASDSHPAIQLVHEACQDQKKACGCGITTLVCISTYWARGVAKLIHQGIPAPVVLEILEEAVAFCEKTALTLAIPVKKFKQKTRAAALSANERIPPPQPSRLREKQHTQTLSSFSTTTKFSSLLNFSAQSPIPAPQASRGLRNGGSGSSSRTRLPNKTKILAYYSRHFIADSGDDKLYRGNEDTESQSLMCTSSNGRPSTESGCAAWIALLGDKLSSGKTVAMQLACRVAEIQLSSSTYKIQPRWVLQCSALGKEQNCSRVVHGAMIELHPEMVTVATKQHGKQLRVVVVDGDCTPDHTHLGLQKRIPVKSYDPQQICESSSKVNWLHGCAEILEQLGVGVVVVGGAMSPLLWEHCIAAGVVVLKGVDRRQMEGVCHITGATPISYLTQCLKRHVGSHAVELAAEELGWTRPSFIRRGQTDRHFERHYICTIKSVAPGSIVSVLLCAKTKSLVRVLEHQFQNCLHKLKLATEEDDGSLLLLPGGGRAEALCVTKLRQKISEINTELSNTDLFDTNSQDYSKISTDVSFAMATSWMGNRTHLAYWRPHVYEVCIQGLLEYTARVIMNSSCSAELDGGRYGAMAKAEELVKKMKRDEKVQGCDEFDVLDVAKSKVGAWRRALTLLRLLFLSTRTRVQKTTTTYQIQTYLGRMDSN